ncbi:MAG: D-aminoacylase [Verrucomicrobiota bacterium]|nr:D-aminoacylase [Verrucomicrobiota bacterium]
MAQDWEIKSRSAACHECRSAFAEGQILISSLVFGPQGYMRDDFCEICWTAKASAVSSYSSWRGTYKTPPPPREEVLKKETAELLLRRLIEQTNETRRNAIFILAVMLERKRILAEKDVRRNADSSITRVYEHRKTGETFVIPDPQLRLDQLEHVQQEIAAMLGGGHKSADQAPDGAQPAPAESEPAEPDEEDEDDDEDEVPLTPDTRNLSSPMLDLKITGCLILDGTGAPAARADIGLRADKIETVGDLARADARVSITAAGKYVCPGFIDAHSHSDASLLVEPSAHSKLYQGITTEVVGNCGASAAPVAGDMSIPSDWKDLPHTGKWRSVAEYRALLEQARPATNVLLLIGHGNLRKAVVGYANRPATAEEARSMKELLARSLDEGGRGLSTGLIYAPGRFASREELIELAGVAAARGGIYCSHMRGEGATLLEAIREAIAIGEGAGIRVQISHLKTAGREHWGLLDAALDLIRAARDKGLKVAADRYTYISSHTDLDFIFPDWVAAGDRDTVLARLRDTAERARLKDDLKQSKPVAYWSTITIASTRHPDNKRFQGVPLVQAAEQLGMDPIDAVIHFARTDGLSTTAFFAGMSEENMFRVLAEPYVMIGTDASARAPTGPLSLDYPHPRAYGTFPRFLRMALDGRSVPLNEAVRKMTSLPAGHFNLTGRGVLAKGMLADVIVFDPVRVRDRADYARPHQLAEGIEHVIVNGVVTMSNSALTGQRAGRLL